MARLILAIIAAPMIWGVLMFGGQMIIGKVYPDVAAQGPFPSGYLVLLLLGTIVYCLITGLACAAIAGTRPMRSGVAAGLALLAVGIGVEASSWDIAPAWYHLTFLALLVPATVAGAHLWRGRPVFA